MASLDAVRVKAPAVIQSALARAAPKASATAVAQVARNICAHLLTSCTSVPAYQQALMAIDGNSQVLGERSLTVAVEKLVTVQDTAELMRLMEADVESRRVVNEFAQSEECAVCGLPKASNKININRFDVEDDVFGKQYEFVFGDCCTCVTAAAAAAAPGAAVAAVTAPAPTTRGSIMSLWDEQNDQAEKQQQRVVADAAAVAAAAAATTASLPQRRDRQAS